VGFDFAVAVGGFGDGIVGVLAVLDVGCILFLSVPKLPGLNLKSLHR
jgi:hypothetical protein